MLVAALSLYDLAAAQAGCAHPHSLRGAFDAGAYWPQIYVPATSAHVVSVADIVSELRLLAADVTNLCHGYSRKIKE